MEKRELKRRKDEDDAVKTKYGLPEDLVLPANDETAANEAKEEFMRARRAFGADQEAKRRRVEAEVGQPRPFASSSRSAVPSSRNAPSSLLRSSSLRSAFESDGLSDPSLKAAGIKCPES